MKELIFSKDKYQMNWLRPDFEYAEVNCPADLAYSAEHKNDGDSYSTCICFTNISEKPYFTNIDSIGIRFPLEDKYESSEVCIPYRCNTHLFCGGNVSYIMALRMGGEAPHLGMVLTEGSLDCYSVERDVRKQSNDRGCFILHPSPMELQPGESARISWTVFPHEGKEDFYHKLSEFSRYVKVEADRYVLFKGEEGIIRITPSFAAAAVRINGRELPLAEGKYELKYHADDCGEKLFDIDADGIHTWCRVYVQEPLEQLAEKRSRFIAEHQQYQGECKNLSGAYLAYDNEEHHIYYNRDNDYNGGRERVGMGLLIAAYLQKCRPSDEVKVSLETSLKKYLDYIRDEIVKQDTGEVCNEMGYDNSYKRLYNFPWYITLFVEVYRLYEDREALSLACLILEDFYRGGGAAFYPIELPVLQLDRELRRAGMEKERERAQALFVKHAENIAETGLHYPVSEVNYEQSIVAPAADILLKTYILTGQERFLEAGRVQLEVLEQFNGKQPDYHLHETAVRHWDGYWFGKKKLYGDTFPHYWSALTGNVYALYASITKDEKYSKLAEDSLRGVLPLFFTDGTASCAYVYPHRVNGTEAAFYDPYANDQDWGLYFNLRYYFNSK